MSEPFPGAGRRTPEHGVHLQADQPTFVFLTVCARDREPWLAQSPIERGLKDCWLASDTWLVGEYLLMPDHLHLFCGPKDTSVELSRWVRWWKRRFSCLGVSGAGCWQRDYWDTRIRDREHYEKKWWYVRENPVRAGLVESPEEWPFQGRLHVLRW
ncbi:MAG: hypothetical protein KIT22_06285 [Verrucomicrobiae bacterium]|nr:hypothetical protein [Verrucomicrobiae bacterium]